MVKHFAKELFPMRFLIPCLALIGCIPPDAAPPPKVRGNYELKHENRLTLRLNVGGAITERTAEGYDEVVDFGTHEGQPIVVDLGKFCDKPDVACPTEALWERVAIDQPNLDSNRLDAYVINVIDNTTRELPPGKRADVLGGIVSSADDRFLIGLGAQSESNEACGIAGLALASGRFSHAGEKLETVTEWRDEKGKRCDPPDTPPAEQTDEPPRSTCEEKTRTSLVWPSGASINGIVEGKISIAYLGACAFGPVIAGATLTLESPFTGTRTGAFDPPPFTPHAPADSLPEF